MKWLKVIVSIPALLMVIPCVDKSCCNFVISLVDFAYTHTLLRNEVNISGGPSPPAVGGIMVPIDKFSLLVPWIATAVVLVAAAIGLIRPFLRKRIR